MQRVAQDWLVLTVLSRDSGVAVGITTGLQFAPILLLAPVAGAVADRYDRRRVLMVTQAVSAVLAVVLGGLVLTEMAQLWHVYVLAALLGAVGAMDGPARHAFVSEVVQPEDLANAVGLNTASFHAGRLLGPAVAGLCIEGFGTGLVFLLNAASFLVALACLSRIRVADLRPVIRTPGRGGARAGLAYVRRRPDIIMIMVIIGMVGTFGLNFQLTTALMARLEFHQEAQAYGLLGSVMAVGSITGALLAARRERPTVRLVIVSTLVFGAVASVAALMPNYTLFAVALVPTGLAALTLMTAANAAVQLATPAEMRGRVMALYMAIFMGGTPLGAPFVGWVGERFGAPWSILQGGIIAMLTALVALVWERRCRRRPVDRPPVPSDVARSVPRPTGSVVKDRTFAADPIAERSG
jgi:MFS family permease